MLDKIIRIITWLLLILIIVLIFWLHFAFSNDKQTIKRYDKDYNLKEYEIREDNRGSVYDRRWNRKGYIIYEDDRAIRFGNEWNREEQGEHKTLEEKED